MARLKSLKVMPCMFLFLSQSSFITLLLYLFDFSPHCTSLIYRKSLILISLNVFLSPYLAAVSCFRTATGRSAVVVLILPRYCICHPFVPLLLSETDLTHGLTLRRRRKADYRLLLLKTKCSNRSVFFPRSAQWPVLWEKKGLQEPD